ncbi:MAG: Mur ligase domain-containing protein, partial [Candidatus Uhrbacteria bacterium]|nr:Mur ligase domain-containing protein [Candidatus Uhrbacteria bacterium]
MAFDDVRVVHLVGAGGIGISAIGKFLLAKGKKVSGSDAKASAITDDLAKRGVTISVGHAAENIPAECDLVVYTEAAPETNPEREEAARRGIRQLGHFDFLGELSKAYRTICVTGTNGKSTTTAMTGRIFEDAGLDPTVFVGSLVPGWELGNLRIGKSDILIIEGDEYKQKMVKLWPEVTVITNIEEDHLDVYRDLDHIVATFQGLIEKTAGTTFVNCDDANSSRLTGAALKQYQASDVADLQLQVPGEFNRANAAAARVVAKAFG